MQKYKGPRLAKSIKKEKAVGLKLLNFNYITTVIETVWYRHKAGHTDQWNKTESPEINPYIYSQLIFDSSGMIIHWKKRVFLTMVLGQLNSHMQKNEMRLLPHIPWTARRSNQSILKEINPEYSLEGLMLKLKLQYFGHLIQKADSLEKTLMLGKSEGRKKGWDRGWDGWMSSLTQCTWTWANSGRQWRTGKPGMLQFMGSQRVRHNLANEQQPQIICEN